MEHAHNVAVRTTFLLNGAYRETKEKEVYLIAENSNLSRMGGGISSLQRSRRYIVVRAFNLREEGVSLRQQLSEVSYRDITGQERLSVEAFSKLLQLEKGEVTELLASLKVSQVILFASCLLFREAKRARIGIYVTFFTVLCREETAAILFWMISFCFWTRASCRRLLLLL